MPHIDVKMFPGRNDEIKKNLAATPDDKIYAGKMFRAE